MFPILIHIQKSCWISFPGDFKIRLSIHGDLSETFNKKTIALATVAFCDHLDHRHGTILSYLPKHQKSEHRPWQQDPEGICEF
jgi:hypothetical protein